MTTDKDTRTAFMEATYRALCTHGYADLTMQDIADQTDKSKAALHYHFDGKDELFREFLEYLHEGFREDIRDHPEGTPAERLVALVRRVLDPMDDESDQQFNTAFMEIKAQAPYREGYREVLRQFDDDLHDEVSTLVAEAVSTGQYDDDTDPDEIADHVLTYIHGTWTRAAAIGADVVVVREHLVEDILDLLVEEASVPVSAETVDRRAIDDDPTEMATDDGEESGDRDDSEGGGVPV
ncbi:TetR/AcrR family transcriptional regulator [Halobaculum sp. CBA1158]|uniref:TetR/AcrR family transcriptional regulator n=1 Tax=Halobaculum sp. CBA1158 TaxID=2904243 RepID=UPI001F325E9E|nr:TetR/AcrR family transcriptional regulator [Halobaculum sp. CBA1158]UIO98714.1 TetR/AcrR family transcriptional regulator [Halobaculum sp. CBA1158]